MIANYTTAVPVKRSVAEIQDMLVGAGAGHVAVSYEGGQPVGLLFTLGGLGYDLPARVSGVHRALQGQRGAKPAQRTEEHARRVAWRILRDWTRAQLSIIQAELVTAHEVFLPWLITHRNDGSAGNRTLYQDWADEYDVKQLEGS
jgi:hypothetical protein